MLGRVSNLPTVWSNVLAAWLLAGGGTPGRLSALLLGATAVYVAGMFLNDACDADFDARHRLDRPIPLGWVREWQVWVAGGGLLVGGFALLAELGSATAGWGLGLVAAVLIYDFTHKAVPFSPVLMALCRIFLFLASSSAAAEGLTGDAAWSAVVLGLYVIGLSYVARRESGGGSIQAWPLVALAAPFLLAGLLNAPVDWTAPTVLFPALFLAGWILRCLSCLRDGGARGRRLAVSGLLAGIALVDALAVAAPLRPWGGAFLGLFALALLFQRRIPAT